jgi:hypothetical protein
MVALVDLSNRETLEAFIAWKNNDGTKEGLSKLIPVEEPKTEPTRDQEFLADLVKACEELQGYRDRNGLNFQLEKLDDYLWEIKMVIHRIKGD